MQVSRILSLMGAVVLGAGALLALLALLSQPATAEVQQTLGYVDGSQGQDMPGCGVGTGSNACQTIQRAIDGGYDVISVTQGLYTESLLVENDLTLQGGWNADFTNWDPVGQETRIIGQSGTNVDTVVISTATLAFLDGLTVYSGDDGVRVLAGAGAQLTRLKVQGVDDDGIEASGAWLIVSETDVFETGDNGILAEQGSVEIYESVVHDTGQVVSNSSRRGVYLRGAGPDTISGTVVYNTGDDGIRVRDAAQGTLMNNRVFSVTQDGIQIDNVLDALVEGNAVYAVAQKDGIKYNGNGIVLLRDNVVHDVDNEGFQIEGNGQATLVGNKVYRTGAAGILAENAGGTALIQSNIVYSTTGLLEDGIHVNPGVEATVQANTVHEVGGDAIDFKGSSGVIEGNEVYAIGDVGIQVSRTLSLSIAHNIVKETRRDGVQVEESGVVFILHNAISHTVTGTGAIYVGPGIEATIGHNSVYSVAADGINFQGSGGQVVNNRVRRAGDQGISVNVGDTMVTTILSNTVSDTDSAGLRVRSGSAVLIQGNTIYNVLGLARDGIRVEPNVAATIRWNEVYSATDDGITFNGSVGEIEENYLHDNGASGLDVDADQVIVAANRLFDNGMVGLELEQAALFTATNNLIGENGDGGVRVMGFSMGRLVNNTLVGDPSGPLGVGVQVLSSTVALTSANNIIISYTTGISVVAGAEVTSTFDDLWSNGLNYQGLTGGAGSIQQNPLLVDVAQRDYHLRLGSACIGAGWSGLADQFPRDFEGHPRVDGVEIGADEVGLGLNKEAPAFAASDGWVTYTLTVSNYYNLELTQVVITDAVPIGAHLVDAWNDQGSVSVLGDDVVRWTVDSVTATGGVVRVGFSVTTTQAITNERYRVVTSTQGVGSGWGPPVVTEVERKLYMPVILRNHSG